MAVTSSMRTLSVISSQRASAGSCARARASATTAMRSGSANWRARKVDRHPQPGPAGRPPGGQLPAGLAQHPPAERQDQAALLGQGDELGRVAPGRARDGPSAPAPRRPSPPSRRRRRSAGSGARSSPAPMAVRSDRSISRRSSMRRRISASNSSMRDRPRSLARYMATSESRSMSSARRAGVGVGDADAGGDDRLPPAEQDRLRPRRRPPARRRRRPRRSVRSSQTTTNSSPARRPTVSWGRTAARSRSEIDRRTPSPAEWPNESLTTLKRSRSTKRTVDPPAASARTGQRLVEPVEDEAAVGQPGERVVGRLVHGVVEGPAHPVDGGGVVEGQGGVLGEGEEHLLLGGGVGAALRTSRRGGCRRSRRCGRRGRPWPSAGRGRPGRGGRGGRRRSPRR